jgi:hypothetical protein
MRFNKIFLGGLIVLLSGCSVWPYKSDFDCPIPKGEQCKALYEINKLADLGKYSPNNDDNVIGCDSKFQRSN